MAENVPPSISIDEVCSMIRYLEDRSNQFDLLTDEYLELQARFSRQEQDYNTVLRELEDVRVENQHQADVATGLESECYDLKEQNELMQKEANDREKQYEKNLQVMVETMATLNEQNERMNNEQVQLSAYMNIILDDMETREQEIERLCEETDIKQELEDACCGDMNEVLLIKKDLIAQNLAYKSKITLLGGLLKETTSKCMELATKLCNLQERFENINAAAQDAAEDPVMSDIECVKMKWILQYRETMQMLQSVHVDYIPLETNNNEDDLHKKSESWEWSEREVFRINIRTEGGAAGITPQQEHGDNAQSVVPPGGSGEERANTGARAKTTVNKKGRAGTKGKRKKQRGNKNNNWRSASPNQIIDPFLDEERVPELPPECYVPPARPTDDPAAPGGTTGRMSIEEIKKFRAKHMKKWC